MKSIAYAIVIAAALVCTTFGASAASVGPLAIGCIAWVALLCRSEK